MRAWILEEQAKIEERPLKLVEVPTPHPQDDEVRLRVLVCGVCRTDIHIAEGDLPLKKSPVILGHEIVGVVDEVGENVERFSVGDQAGAYWLYSSCGKCKYCLSKRENYCPEIKCTGWDEDGGYAEYVTVPAEYALPLNNVQMEPAEIAPLMLELLGLSSRRRIATKVGVSLFPFEELQDALILAKQGKLEQPNAVIQVADR
ncbi:MAG: alcohol dehydrogenase catalytic domain-containing protein [Anaerolineae bacterium]